jgi:ubiquinone/menaquinone biosynthesis C-methylase UbiE
MATTAEFWDRIAPKYSKRPIGDMAAYEYTLDRTRSYLSPEDRVLELGCGTGSTALLLASGVREIVGTDMSGGMLDIAREKARTDDVDNARFEVMTAERATMTEDPFNAVLGFNLFHLTEDPERLFRNIHDRLPKGGYFISKTPCIGDPSMGVKRHGIRVLVSVMQLFGKAPMLRYLTQSGLEAMIESAGFEIVESGNYPEMSRFVVARRP